jgi:hypothetical protein
MLKLDERVFAEILANKGLTPELSDTWNAAGQLRKQLA